nr:glycerol-3-phosphate 1-O-acyltransferase PlsY [Desulfobacterales bacterium]
MIYKILVLPIGTYLICSIPFGLLLTRVFSDVNILEAGSKNIGATNVLRLTGKWLALFTFTGDMLKGAVPVYLAVRWMGLSSWQGELYVSLVVISALCGHTFSVFLGFKGGKGVATTVGCFVVISPLTILSSLLVFILVVYIWGYVSAGSLSLALTLPVAIWFQTHSITLSICAVLVCAFIFCRHKDNIKRIIAGTEDKFLMKFEK